MPRSNAPLALSLVTLTVPDSVQATVDNITAFDGRKFGFSHDGTWAAMPAALRGVLDPSSVAKSFGRTPLRVQRCIAALCRLGIADPKDTRRFVDHPEAGLRTVESIEWGSDVRIRVKGTCWYTEAGVPVIPVLQPRKATLAEVRLAIYLRLVRQAYCQGDWARAQVKVLDLSGSDDHVVAVPLCESQIGQVTDSELNRYVNVFIEAKRIADAYRQSASKPATEVPMEKFF